jgi:hypothetical protein
VYYLDEGPETFFWVNCFAPVSDRRHGIGNYDQLETQPTKKKKEAKNGIRGKKDSTYPVLFAITICPMQVKQLVQILGAGMNSDHRAQVDHE